MPKRRPNRPQIDWLRARQDFVEGIDTGGERMWPSLHDLAASYGVDPSSVAARARDGAWPAEREAFRTEIDTERRRRVLESRVEQVASIDKRALSASEAGIALVGTRLTMLVGEATRDDVSIRGRGVNAQELAALGLAAKRFMEVKSIVVGVPVAGGEETVEEADRAARVMEMAMADRLADHAARRAVPLDDDVEVG
jgi:hypothetical protein